MFLLLYLGTCHYEKVKKKLIFWEALWMPCFLNDKISLPKCHEEVIPNKKRIVYSQHSRISQSTFSNGKNEGNGPQVYFHDSLMESSRPSNSILDEKEQFGSIACIATQLCERLGFWVFQEEMIKLSDFSSRIILFYSPLIKNIL